MEEKILNEVIKRMKRLQLHGNVLRDFRKKKRVLNYSEPINCGFGLIGALYWVEDEEILAKIKEVEEEYNITVYHLIHNNTEFGELYSMLYVDNDGNDYEEDNRLLNQGIQYAYVWNKTDDMCSEFGTIAIRPAGGGIVRYE